MSYQYQQGNQENFFQDNLQKDKYTHQFSQDTTNLLAGQRNKFCQKVFGILTTQVMVTVGFIALAQQSIGFRVFQENNQFLMTLSSIGSIIILLVLGCVKTIARKTPTNYYLLFAFTIMEAYGVSALTLRYDSQIVLQSGIMTLLSFGSLTAFAFLTKKDFTKYHGFLFMVFQTVMIFSLIFALFGTKSMNIVFSAIGILIVSGYLIIDIQMLMGNKKLKLEMDDYIFASLMIYIDLVNLFIKLLQFVDKLQKDENNKKKK